MIITNPNPIIQPPSDSKEYPAWWIQSLQINANDPNKVARAIIHLCPYNATTKEILNTDRKTIIIDDVFSAANTNPDIANAVLSILNAVNSLANQ